jgi:hypothetical protein
MGATYNFLLRLETFTFSNPGRVLVSQGLRDQQDRIERVVYEHDVYVSILPTLLPAMSDE